MNTNDPPDQSTHGLEPTKWDNSLSAVKADMGGHPLNIHCLMAQHPSLLNAWWPLRNHLVSGGALGQRRGELVVLRTAFRMRNWYEWASHVVRALEIELQIDQVAEIGQWSMPNHWSAKDRVLIVAVDELFEEQRISPQTRQMLEGHYSIQQILDVIAIFGMYATVARFINTWNVLLDESVADALPSSVTQNRFAATTDRTTNIGRSTAGNADFQE